jgi:hypothetical protein
LDIGWDLVAREPVDLESIRLEPGGVDTTLGFVERGTVRSLSMSATASVALDGVNNHPISSLSTNTDKLVPSSH